jgi:hypothetical protein
MRQTLNDSKLPLVLFSIWVLVYIFIGPGFPYIKPLHSSNSLLIAGTILGAILLSFSLFLSYRVTVLRARVKSIVATFFILFVFAITITASIHLASLQFQIVSTFNDTLSMGKSKILSHGKSAWEDKDWEKASFLARFIFRDYGVRIAYHTKNGDVVIFTPDDEDLNIRDRNIDTEQKARNIFPTLLDQAKRHQIYSYIYLSAFFFSLIISFFWNFVKNRKEQSR